MKVVKHTFGFSIEKICVVYTAYIVVETHEKCSDN